jgi:hypothetical protein
MLLLPLCIVSWSPLLLCLVFQSLLPLCIMLWSPLLPCIVSQSPLMLCIMSQLLLLPCIVSRSLLLPHIVSWSLLLLCAMLQLPLPLCIVSWSPLPLCIVSRLLLPPCVMLWLPLLSHSHVVVTAAAIHHVVAMAVAMCRVAVTTAGVHQPWLLPCIVSWLGLLLCIMSQLWCHVPCRGHTANMHCVTTMAAPMPL